VSQPQPLLLLYPEDSSFTIWPSGTYSIGKRKGRKSYFMLDKVEDFLTNDKAIKIVAFTTQVIFF
jgi:hypothetical protein